MEEEKLLKRRRKAQRDNNEAVLISTCTDLANLYQELGRFEFAIEEYTILANLYKTNNQQLEYAVVNRGIGEAYLGLQNYETALHHFKIYYETVKELRNKLEEQRALATIGHTYLTMYSESPNPDKNHLVYSNKFFTKSMDICESLSDEISKLEVADMRTRLFCNLGLVQDCLGQTDKAMDLITKSITLCKSNDLYEQLYRGHMNLASILERKQDSKAALQQYNLAVETAKKLRDKPSLLAGALMSKAELLIKLGDFHGARNALLKAYKLQIPNTKERDNIEHHLRVVASMCKNEDKLLTTRDTDYPTLKTLYEKMGDAACDLKNYEKAIDYYKKMLDCIKNGGLSDAELSSCYYSLAETYKDNGQFQEAIHHFEQELQLCKKLKDKLNTLSKLADMKESSDCASDDVETVYEQAIELCREDGDRHEEGRMLKRFIIYLKRQQQHSKAAKLQQNLDQLNYQSSDSDGESSTPAGSVVGNDIDLEDITDDSDSDNEPRRRRPPKNYIVKRNAKGETPLHTACIHGKLNVVRHLLDQGHPVNVRDHCGWLPLHEACNHGRLDIVKLLVEKGAAINDRGGVGCEGVTPLHDAALNGHLDIVQLLLSKGANPLAKTDSGDSVLCNLTRWRNSVKSELRPEVEGVYREIVSRITQALDKAGQNTSKEQEMSGFEDLRRSTTVGLEDDEDDFDSPVSPSKIAQSYKSVMERFRRRSEGRKVAPPNLSSKRPALIAESELVEDWLEDDVGKSVKKRKTTTDSPVKSSTTISQRRSFNEVIDLDEDEDSQMDYPTPETPSTSKSPVKTFKKRKHQAKLTKFGHTRTFVEADSTSSPGTNKKTPPKLAKTPSFDNPPPVVVDPMFSVDVRVEEKLYRVPVLSSQINTHNIKWLANEAAKRYARKEYMVPVLELESKNGAILAEDDFISILFPMGGAQAEEVTATIVKWTLPPLSQRYNEACQDMGVEASGRVSQMLEEFSVILDMSNQGLKGNVLAPLCKVLNRQTNLMELDLSGNFLTGECVQYLSASLVSLNHLYKLNLNCTSLSSELLRLLTSKLSDGDSYKISDLDLGENTLDDQSFQSLALITRFFELKKLNLSCNKFTKNLFSFNRDDVTLNLDHVEEFDVSDNDLSNDALVRILGWLNPCLLKSLNLSRNGTSHGFLRDVLSKWGELDELRLVTLKLSRCYVHDSDLFDLLRLTKSLENLDLSYNNELTSISLRRLFQADHLINLSLYGCSNIFKYFTELTKYLEQPTDKDKGKTVKLSLDLGKDTENQCLMDVWKQLYGDRAVLERNFRLLCLSVAE